ncbi:MAG: glutamyl-tRNA reductase [Actinomycetota bacterium]|nr:glutamyl-tRNA reductase [Actinomycetota bacterium]
MSVVVVGANHRTASLDLLERMVVPGERLPKLLHGLDACDDVSEVAMLATCNRTEVYVVAERFHSAYGQIRDFFSDLTHLPPDLFAEHLYVHYDDQAVRHLFEVAAGLDSAVPGEHEIQGQVRQAWQTARDEGTSRRSLNMLFRHALEVGKRARTETRIAHHVTSVSQAAVIMAGEHLAGIEPGGSTLDASPVCAGARAASGLAGRRVVVVGAGAMARGMASFLADAGVAEMTIANRTPSRAEALAESLSDQSGTTSIQGVPLDDLGAHLVGADVLFTATDATDPVVTLDHVEPAMATRAVDSMLVVDVGMPRDVAAEVGSLAGVELLDMEAVAALTDANLAARHAEADAVHEIVDAEVARYESLTSAREVAPVVTALRQQVEGVRLAELDRFAARLEGLEPGEREAVEALTKGIVAKLLHSPTVRLKDAAGSGRGDRLAESVRELFDLS